MAKNELSPLAKQLWGLAIAQGVLAILFGIVALFWPGLTVAILIALFGIFVLVWGVVGLIVSLSSISTDKFWWLELIFSLLAVGLAVYVLRNPETAAAIFVFFIGITFLVRGVIDVLEGLFDRERDGGDRVFRAIVGALGILAGIITLSYPVTAGLAVVWVIGLYAVLYGALLIAFAFRAQGALKK
ncbi:DUF308 domain-containing protein [Candidatus Saccharibacteria bacterium]|nr:DUF308 domain-containing protein [Candidatus Saccharibacteria bacterium]